MSAMAKLFSKYVENGVYMIEQVPAKWRAEVEQILAEEDTHKIEDDILAELTAEAPDEVNV